MGKFVLSGMVRGDLWLTMAGIVPILFITFFVFLGLGKLADLARHRTALGFNLALAFLVLIGIYVASATLFSFEESRNPSEKQLSVGEKVNSSTSPNASAASASIIGFVCHTNSPLLFPVVLETLTQESQNQTKVTKAPVEQTENGGSQDDNSFYQTIVFPNGFADQVWAFVSLATRGLGLALLFGLPIGIVLTRFPGIAQPIMSSLALIQTIPSLALLGACVSLFGLFGPSAAIFAAVVYSLFPIILNTYVGIMKVDPSVRGAARGMGMNDIQVLLKIELPLAFPVLIAGIRTAGIYAISMVTICTLVGARGLGDYIFEGMTTENDSLILLGVIPILIFSFLLFWLLSGVSYLSKIGSSSGMVVGCIVIVFLSGFALIEPWLRRRPDVLVGSKNFTEGRILAEIIKQMIERSPETKHLSVEMAPNLGSNFVYKSLRAGVVDVYPEYTGTLLTAQDGLDAEVPEDKTLITKLVRTGMKSRYNLLLLKTFGLNNTYALIVKSDYANLYQLEKISDLKRVPKTRTIVDQEFLQRSDGWKGLVESYKLKFQDPPKQFDSNFLYRSLMIGKADMVIGYSTDWQIAHYNLVILEDDKNYFPSYHAAPLVRQELIEKYPEIKTVLSRLHNQISEKDIQNLNYQVATKKLSPQRVARDFLVQEKRLIPSPQSE